MQVYQSEWKYIYIKEYFALKGFGKLQHIFYVHTWSYVCISLVWIDSELSHLFHKNKVIKHENYAWSSAVNDVKQTIFMNHKTKDNR